MSQTALVKIDNASLDEPLVFHVNLSPRVLRTLAVLADVQEFHLDGHFELACSPDAAEGEATGDEELVDFVVLAGANEAQQQALREYIDQGVEEILEGGQ
jgi:hypothetical protein